MKYLLVIVAILVTAAPARAESGPCQVAFRSGVIELAPALPPTGALPATTDACVSALARRIIARPGIRSVTVAVRLPDAQRVAGDGLRRARDIADRLVRAGVPRRRVSVVAPASRAGEKPSLRLAYTERRSKRPVARIDVAFGLVETSRDPDHLARAHMGQMLVAYQYVRTGPGAAALLSLADGSVIRLSSRTLLRLGPIDLDAQLRRRVRITLVRGYVSTIAQAGGMGLIFQIITRMAVAGVRGTRFRVAATSTDTRLETTEGAVVLGGKHGTVRVGAAFGSRVDASGTPEAPRPLLTAPAGLRPTRGALALTQPLTWKPVPGAVRYMVDVAEDAEFSRGLTTRSTATPSLALARSSRGKRFWRVMAVDRDGFVGMPSKVYAFVR